MSGSHAFLSLDHVAKRYGGVVAIQDVTLHVPPGEIHGVIGPNGAGKTSLFNCITSFSRPTAGVIWFNGGRIDGLAPNVIAARGIARTYQNVRLFQEMTALENVLVGQHRRLAASILGAIMRTPTFKAEEGAAADTAMELLTFVGIAGRAGVMARNLSYGDQRRLEIARSLATSPKLLLLDEPAAGMNPSEAAALVRLVKSIRDSLGITILLIEHHMHVVMSSCDIVTVLDRGSVIASGKPSEIQTNQVVVEAYLGQRKKPAQAPAGPGMGLR
jgi:branched-chain amino acid transport system ATP-binding protein